MYFDCKNKVLINNMWSYLSLSSIIVIFCQQIHGLDPISAEEPTRTFPYRRAVDGTRGSKYYDPHEDDTFDIYDPYDEETDFSDYRSNVPGEPGIDYPSYTRIPQTSFTCESQFRGYYADEGAGCQLFHVCDGNFLVSSFLCPIGSIFSQKLLTCDWWNKVDCAATSRYYQTIDQQSTVSEVDDDEYLRKAYEMTSLQSADNGVSIDPRDQINNVGNIGAVSNLNNPAHVNDLASSERYPDYSDSRIPSRSNYPQFKYSSRYSGTQNHNRNYNDPNNNNNNNDYDDGSDDKSSIRIHTIGKDRKDNDGNQYNQFQPSYAPTVPTVTTTTRRFYSPTVPTIIRSTPRSRYDLEFESSDHLYSAKGKTRSTTTVVPLSSAPTSTTERINYASVTPINVIETHLSSGKNSFGVPELHAFRGKSSFHPKEIVKTSEDSDIIHISLLKSSEIEEPTENPYEFPESPITNIRRLSEINNSNTNSTNSIWYESNAIAPAISFLPPFSYYSGIDLQNSISAMQSDEPKNEPGIESALDEESTTSWYDESVISVPSIEIIPPIKDKLDEEETTTVHSVDYHHFFDDKNCSLDLNSVNKDTISPSNLEDNNVPILHSFLDTENTTYPFENYEYQVVNRDNVELGVTDDILESSTVNFLKNYFDEKKKELLGDLVGGESSPVQVTLTVNNDEEFDPSGEFIRSLIAQHDPVAADHFKDFEVVKSQPPRGGGGKVMQTTHVEISQKTETNKLRTDNRANNSPKSQPKIKSVDIKNDDNLPRPFSITNQDIKAIDNPEIMPVDGRIGLYLPEKTKRVTFPNADSKNQTSEKKVNFVHFPDLPEEIEIPTEDNPADFHSSKKNVSTKSIAENNKSRRDNDINNWNKTRTIKEKYIVETELVPSIAFSLDTKEGRDEFSDAVERGILTDIPPILHLHLNNNTTIKNPESKS